MRNFIDEGPLPVLYFVMISPLSSQDVSSARVAPVSGIVRKGRRTKDLVKRLKPGDIALIDHADIDAIAAQSLVDCQVVAVIDSAAPVTGRYPNRGPSLLADARVPLYQLADPDDFDRISDREHLSISGNGDLRQNATSIPSAVQMWTPERVTEATERARLNLASELEKFAENTLEYVRKENGLLVDSPTLPDLAGVRNMARRHVVIVVRGEGYKEDLASIASYIRDVKPVIIAVDGGADALAETGLHPDIILGDMDSVSDAALKSGAKLIVHAYASGEAPGLARIKQMGLSAETFSVPGTSEDAAMLLAYEKRARLIVAVGTHSNLIDFLDKGRAGMASTFLVRLKVGSRLVDARGVSQLHQRRVSTLEFSSLFLSAACVLIALMSQSAFVQNLVGITRNWLRLRVH